MLFLYEFINFLGAIYIYLVIIFSFFFIEYFDIGSFQIKIRLIPGIIDAIFNNQTYYYCNNVWS